MTNDQMSHMEFKVAAAVRGLEWNSLGWRWVTLLGGWGY